MKTLVIITHPNLEQSRINRTWMEELKKHEEITIHTLYQAYPDGKINVAHEQSLLESHDRIILQFPFYWYSTPSLLKQWQDEVLTYGWAYGPEGTNLRGKDFMLVISTGGPESAYQAGGYNHFSMSELTKPFQATANLTGMNFMPTFTKHGVRLLTDEQVHESAEELVRHLKNNY